MQVSVNIIEGAYLRDLLDPPEALRRTYQGLDGDRGMLQAANSLRSSGRIVLTGMGSSLYALYPLYLKLLDAGSYGLICPMINTKAEAEQFVSYGRYPPIGSRSMGPNRAVQYAGADYWQGANEEVILLAMIETRAGLKNLDAIRKLLSSGNPVLQKKAVASLEQIVTDFPDRLTDSAGPS